MYPIPDRLSNARQTQLLANAYEEELSVLQGMPQDRREWTVTFGTCEVVADFNGGAITGDGGVVLLAEIENKRRIVARFAECFTDHRNSHVVEHPLADLLEQRIFAICQGYEDLVDHDLLRRDVALAAAVGELDPDGAERSRQRDRGCPLAGKSTLHRLERSLVGADADSRYAKTPLNVGKAQGLFVDFFLEPHAAPPT